MLLKWATQPEVTSLSYTHASPGLFCVDHGERAALTCSAEVYVVPASSDGVRAPPTSAMREKNTIKFIEPVQVQTETSHMPPPNSQVRTSISVSTRVFLN